MNGNGNPHIAIVFNEPNYSKELEYRLQQAVSKGESQHHLVQDYAKTSEELDLSEVGILDAMAQVRDSLREAGYKISIFPISTDISKLIDFLKAAQPTLVFNLCESLRDRAINEMHVAGIYELLGIPYTGSPALTLGTCLLKWRVKEILAHHRIPTPRFVLYRTLGDISLDEFAVGFPAIVKPAHEDASSGIENASIVSDFSSLRERCDFIFQSFKQPALVEQYIDGRELNLSVLGNGESAEVLPISEIDFSGLPGHYPRIVTYRAKWVENSEEFQGTVGKCPAELAPGVERRVRHIGLKAFRLLGCHDYARIDIRLRKDGEPFVLEVNPNPDITMDSGFARSSAAAGLQYSEMIQAIVRAALERCGGSA